MRRLENCGRNKVFNFLTCQDETLAILYTARTLADAMYSRLLVALHRLNLHTSSFPPPEPLMDFEGQTEFLLMR